MRKLHSISIGLILDSGTTIYRGETLCPYVKHISVVIEFGTKQFYIYRRGEGKFAMRGKEKEKEKT